jgi:hypothetical protein
MVFFMFKESLMNACRAAFAGALGMLLASLVGTSAAMAADPPGRDAVLDWNAVALEAVVHDHSGTFGPAVQGGPTRTSRALAIVHAAIFDAVNSIEPRATPYGKSHPAQGASIDAAVATAAHDTLTALYPPQGRFVNAAYRAYLTSISNHASKARGIAVGAYVARHLLRKRMHDNSAINVPYYPSGDPGYHDVDPLNPGQGYLSPGWGNVTPFALNDSFDYVPLPPPDLDSAEYAAAFNDVKALGGDGVTTATARTREQTEIGIYWAYDGAPGIGVPPRLYNQIVRAIAIQQGTSEVENARLFALVNFAQADAGIVSWKLRYMYDLWRPVLGIRRAGEHDNLAILADPEWTPLGAPASNQGGNDFTPPFPSYTSGHATFGAATFGVLKRFFGRDNIQFTFVSDELNGVTTDSLGQVRPYRPRTFGSFSEAARENARSRIYLGIHWQFDADEGVRGGYAVANHVFDNVLLPISHP